jgi:hypothetical protein
MAAPTAIGINQVSHATAQSVEVTSQGEVAILVDKAGKFSKAAVYDPKYSFTVSGKGATCPVSVNATGTGKPSAISGGKVIVNSVKNQTNNDDWESWEYSGEGFPSAT